MRIFLSILGVCSALVFFGHSAIAVEVEVVEDLTPIPPMVETETLVAQPLSPWMVEEFQRGNGFPTGECIMRANYSNNLEITFKGKTGQLSAIRVRDLNEGSKVKGFLALGLDGNSYGLQSKSTQGQIDASLLTVPAPAEKIMDLEKYKLRIGADDYFFSTDGFALAYQDLLRCHGYENAKTMQVVSTPRAVPVVLEKSPLKKMKPSKIDDDFEMPAEPIDLVMTKDLGSDDVVDNDLSVRMDTWQANKGEKLSSVLEIWALQAGVKPQIDLKNDIALDRDFKIFGPLDIAVSQILKDTMGENSTLSYIESADGDVTSIDQIKQGVVNSTRTGSVNNELKDRVKWRALQGTNLEKVLKRWSIKEGVDFVWDADQTFLIKQTMKAMSDYNGAVASILNQYNGQNVKPVGSLNVDPSTGRKTLIISVDGRS